MERLVDTSTLSIDPEFKNYLPHGAWSTSKQARVEAEILEDGGTKEPLTVWKGTNIIVDGQHRYAICHKHGLQVRIVEREFADRDAVKAFMVRKLLDDERGLNPAEYAMALAEDLKWQKQLGVKRSAEKAAAAAGVDKTTIYRHKSYGEALSSLPDDIRNRIVAGEIKASRETVIELAGFGQFHQLAIVALFDRGDYSSLADALKGNGGTKGGTKSEPDDEGADGESGDDVPFDTLVEQSPQPAECGNLPQNDASPPPPAKSTAKPADSPRPPRPSRKPIKEIFNDAQRELAKVANLLDQARGATKRETNYVDCTNKLKALSDAIAIWSNKSA